jgi:hypothetical protein
VLAETKVNIKQNRYRTNDVVEVGQRVQPLMVLSTNYKEVEEIEECPRLLTEIPTPLPFDNSF